MNAEQKRWLQRVADYANDHGCFPHHNQASFELHHVVGRTYKQNKVHIGDWFIIPVQFEYHHVNSNNPFNVTHFRKRYSIEFGNQRDQFVNMCDTIRDEDGSLPFGDDVMQAIMSTRH